MQAQAYQVFIPIEVDDIIKATDHPNKYKVIDILHTYSASKQTIVSVDLVLYDLVIKREVKLPYQTYTWEVVKDEQ